MGLKKEQGRGGLGRVDLGWFGSNPGSGQENRTGSGGVYKGCETPFYSFCVVFSLSSLPPLKKMLSSLSSYVLLPYEFSGEGS